MGKRVMGKIYHVRTEGHYDALRGSIVDLARKSHNPSIQINGDRMDFTATYTSSDERIVYSVFMDKGKKNVRIAVTPTASASFPRFLDHFFEATGISLESLESRESLIKVEKGVI